MSGLSYRSGAAMHRVWTPAEDARICAVLAIYDNGRLPNGVVPQLAYDCGRTVASLYQRVSERRRGVAPAYGEPDQREAKQPRPARRQSGQYGAMASKLHAVELRVAHPPEQIRRRCSACRVPFEATSRFLFRCAPCRREADSGMDA